MVERIDIFDLDCIFLTYYEPRREEFLVKIQNMIPYVKHVDGVRGSDAAHKAAARASETERFILIDGDNLPNPDFFEQTLTLDEHNREHQFRWRARNSVNDLCYGNGGVSCWTRTFVENMRTHEASDGRAETAIEFCYDPRYTPMHDCWSTTYINQHAKQAFRAGFREGVKLSTEQGRRIKPEQFETLWWGNRKNLMRWWTIGRDVEHGEWAMYGARLGSYMTLLTDWDYTQVQDFLAVDRIFEQHVDQPDLPRITRALNTVLRQPIQEFDSEQSRFIKSALLPQHQNVGIMRTEREFLNPV